MGGVQKYLSRTRAKVLRIKSENYQAEMQELLGMLVLRAVEVVLMTGVHHRTCRLRRVREAKVTTRCWNSRMRASVTARIPFPLKLRDGT